MRASGLGCPNSLTLFAPLKVSWAKRMYSSCEAMEKLLLKYCIYHIFIYGIFTQQARSDSFYSVIIVSLVRV